MGWGGAGAALARSALAGGLSASVETGWTVAQWFTESAGGLLVSTAADDAATFAEVVPQATRIGTVTLDEALSMDGETVSTAALLTAYKSHESGEISR